MPSTAPARVVPAAPLDLDAVALTLQPIGAARMLPAAAYAAADVFEWERQNLFGRHWVCAGRAEEFDAIATEITLAGHSLIVLRDADGVLRAAHNVCRHRGHELLAAGSGAPRALCAVSTTRGATGLTGLSRLLLTPTPLEGFDPQQYGLMTVATETWNGWVFVNLSGSAAPLTEALGELSDVVAGHSPGELRIGAVHDYTVQSNWKLLSENYQECYHCRSIHPELCRVSPPTSGKNIDNGGLWIGGPMVLADKAETMSLSGMSESAPIATLSAEDRKVVYYLGLFPNLLISLHPDYVLTHRLEPLGPDTTRVVCHWLFPQDALARDDFDPAYAVDFWNVTNVQDFEACEAVQRGIASPGFRPGPFTPREDAVHRFAALVANLYLGES